MLSPRLLWRNVLHDASNYLSLRKNLISNLQLSCDFTANSCWWWSGSSGCFFPTWCQVQLNVSAFNGQSFLKQNHELHFSFFCNLSFQICWKINLFFGAQHTNILRNVVIFLRSISDGKISRVYAWFLELVQMKCIPRHCLCLANMTSGFQKPIDQPDSLAGCCCAEVPSASNHMMSTFFFFKRGGLERHNYSFCLRVFIHLSHIPCRAVRFGWRKCFVLMII